MHPPPASPAVASEPLTIAISALQHYSYCPRQCALIHVEQIFDENVYTLRGQLGHERADSARESATGGVSGSAARTERALPLWSDRLGLSGRADVVEFHPDGRVFPVEYKHGPRRVSRHDEIQLCAQALCLEEMLGARVAAGAIYSLTTRRRREVAFDADLRAATQAAIEGARRVLTSAGPLPPAPADERCPKCSLVDACVPGTLKRALAAGRRAPGALFVIDDEEGSAAI